MLLTNILTIAHSLFVYGDRAPFAYKITDNKKLYLVITDGMLLLRTEIKDQAVADGFYQFPTKEALEKSEFKFRFTPVGFMDEEGNMPELHPVSKEVDQQLFDNVYTKKLHDQPAMALNFSKNADYFSGKRVDFIGTPDKVIASRDKVEWFDAEGTFEKNVGIISVLPAYLKLYTDDPDATLGFIENGRVFKVVRKGLVAWVTALKLKEEDQSVGAAEKVLAALPAEPAPSEKKPEASKPIPMGDKVEEKKEGEETADKDDAAAAAVGTVAEGDVPQPPSAEGGGQAAEAPTKPEEQASDSEPVDIPEVLRGIEAAVKTLRAAMKPLQKAAKDAEKAVAKEKTRADKAEQEVASLKQTLMKFEKLESALKGLK